MNHFDDEAWSDYARQVLPDQERRRMQQHLESGCPRCAQLLALWEAVHRAGSRMYRHEPPVAVVRTANAAFVRPQPPQGPLPAWIAPLLFDSFASAPLAGVRSASSPTRHLLYQVESWTIDLRLDTENRKKIMIDGQVLDSSAEDASAARLEIVLLQGEAELARTPANDFGEFQFSSDRLTDLEIHIESPGRASIRVKLPE